MREYFYQIIAWRRDCHFFMLKIGLSCLLILSTLYAFAEIPSGYYNTATGTGATLKSQLCNIISNHTVKSYDYLWTAFQTTDAKSNGKVWDMYSDNATATLPYEFTFGSNQCGTYSVEGDCYNREHSWPKSWFNDASPMYSDLFHLYPTDGKVNGMRSNYPFGEVSSPTWTSENGSKLGPCSYSGYTGTVFEPIDAYKGDFARTYFYMATRYENEVAGWEKNDTNGDAVLNGTSFPVFETWFLNMLYAWHVADPVSAKETARNDAVYGIQGNRNPFIDHPEYVAQIWGFSGGGSGETPMITMEKTVATGATLDFGTVQAKGIKTLHVKTTDVTGNLTVSVSGSGFSASVAGITQTNANAGYDLTITYIPQAAGTYTGTLTISGGGLNPVYQVSLTGKKN